jgi:hypothetical protein
MEPESVINKMYVSGDSEEVSEVVGEIEIGNKATESEGEASDSKCVPETEQGGKFGDEGFDTVDSDEIFGFNDSELAEAADKSVTSREVSIRANREAVEPVDESVTSNVIFRLND